MKRLILALALLLVVAGCGYHLPGRGTTLPDDVHSVVILPFGNSTTEPFIETHLTNEIRDQFLRRRTLQVVEDKEGADAVLSGSVSGYSVAAIAYDADDDIAEYRVTIHALVTLQRVDNERIIWHGEVSWNDEFRSSPDRAHQDYNEKIAQDEVCKRLAQEVYNRLTDNF